LLQQIVELGLISQRQGNRHADTLRVGEVAD